MTLDEQYALIAERDRLRERVRVLEAERVSGPMPNECHKPECGTIRYGTGYKVCPSCGSSPSGPESEGA